MNLNWMIWGAVPFCLMAAGCGSKHGTVSEGVSAASASLRVDTAHVGAHSYLVIYAASGIDVRFTSRERPEPANPDVLLCVAAAFTGEDLTTVCGSHVVAGQLCGGYSDVTGTGHLLSAGGKVDILPQGVLRQSIAEARKEHGWLFQQCYIVEHGAGRVERVPKAIRDRRACIVYRAACIMGNGGFAVIQCLDDQLPEEFVNGLVALGVREALYLDMGSWGYGWYRTSADAPLHELASRFANTRYQSNWLMLVAR